MSSAKKSIKLTNTEVIDGLAHDLAYETLLSEKYNNYVTNQVQNILSGEWIERPTFDSLVMIYKNQLLSSLNKDIEIPEVSEYPYHGIVDVKENEKIAK